jgi:ubiquinone/menaquinone biosynthesis C-methylase UbiE
MARIAELRRKRQMSTKARGGPVEAAGPKAMERAMWGRGNYHAFAKATVWPVGPVLVEAAGIGPGQRVLDVAAGTGNVAIRAAEAGAAVVASDLTPENFDAGREEAQMSGVDLEWVEADAEALPFDDGSFDAVTSAFGAIFAPDQRAVADELLRVCRPGGAIAMANFTPDSLAAEFFGLFGRYSPAPPPGAVPPTMWGSEEHVRDLFAGASQLELRRERYVERAGSAQAYCELFKSTFGPVQLTFDALSTEPERAAELDREFLAFATRANEGSPDGPAEYPYEYLLVMARR